MRLINDIRELERLAGRLAGEQLIAADTEAAGYHRYVDRVCLLQLSTRDETWLVDALAMPSLNPIAELFASTDVEVIFHDADYDLRILDRDFGIHVRGLFDTKIAARFTGERSFGLGNLLESELGVRVEKKYQRADWAKRPLSDDMLDYAATDTTYLPALRDRIRNRLIELGRLDWAEEEFRYQEQTGWEDPDEEGLAFLRLKGTRDLDAEQLTALREVYAWRESVAAERDVAPFRVLNNDVVVELARRAPADRGGLESIRGLSEGNIRRYGDDLLAALSRARSVPASERVERPRRPRGPRRDPDLDTWVDRLKAVRDRLSEDLGLERGFLMPRSQLEDLARERPKSRAELAAIEGVRKWQVDALGGPLLDALNRNGGNSN